MLVGCLYKNYFSTIILKPLPVPVFRQLQKNHFMQTVNSSTVVAESLLSFIQFQFNYPDLCQVKRYNWYGKHPIKHSFCYENIKQSYGYKAIVRKCNANQDICWYKKRKCMHIHRNLTSNTAALSFAIGQTLNEICNQCLKIQVLRHNDGLCCSISLDCLNNSKKS